MEEQKVILVNEQDEPLGVMGKLEVHQKGLLHRAFSIFIFNKEGEMLLQQRSADKYHSAGLWTNACCSHPRPGEEIKDAATRRLREELGFETGLEKVFQFIYRARFENGLTEHELDHVFVGEYNGEVQLNDREVIQTEYRMMNRIKHSLASRPESFTAWFRIAFPVMEEWWNERYGGE